MSATLTWFNSGLGTKTGTAIGNLFADLVTLIQAFDGDANASWEYAGSNIGSTPYWIVLKRKDASVGRILIVSWSSAPAGNHAVLLGGAPTANQVFITYFPAGNADTASNLTAASGTILGDDTDALKVVPSNTVGGLYPASYQPFYFDCADGCMFGFQNPATSSIYLLGAGNLIVDAADNAYPCAIGPGVSSGASFGASTSPMMPWITTIIQHGLATAHINTNYGGANRAFFQAYTPSGSWASVAPAATDILSDTGASKRYYAPVHLLGQSKGTGILLKLRQIAWGSGTTGPFEAYSTTGPVVKARQFCAATVGGSGHMWMTNFKL